MNLLSISMHKIVIIYLVLFCPITMLGQLNWQRTNSPRGVRSILIEKNRIYIGSDRIHYSENNGITWSQSNIITNGIFSLTAYGSALFAGSSNGLFISNDNGVSWRLNSSIRAGVGISSIIVSSNVILAGSQTSSVSMYRSVDSGKTWVISNTGLTFQSIQALTSNKNNVFAGSVTNGIYRSTNNGISWVQSNSGLTNLNILSLAANGDTIFAGTSGGGVFRSFNNGQSWIEVSTGLTNKQIVSLSVYKGVIYAKSETALFSSTNNGDLWTKLNIEADVLFSNENEFWIANNFSGSLYRLSSGGITWQLINSGINEQMATSLVAKGNEIWASYSATGGIASGIFKSNNLGTIWSNSNFITSVLSLGINSRGIFAASSARILFSNNDGSTWNSRNIPGGATLNNMFVGDSVVYIATSSGLYRSLNDGLNWSVVGGVLFTNKTVSYVGAAGSTIFVFSRENSEFYQSSDNGTTWNKIDLGISGYFVFDLKQIGQTIFLATNKGMFRSNNNGRTWTAINTGLSGSSLIVYSIEAVGSTIYISTETDGNQNARIFRSINNGNSWSLDNQGLFASKRLNSASQILANEYVTKLLYTQGNLFAATNGGGIFRAVINTTSVRSLNSDSFKNSKLHLEQNTPNPFSNETNIKFELSEGGNVRLLIHDISGKLVFQVMKNQLNAGLHQISLSAQNLTSGTYFYTLIANGHIASKKMIILR